MIAIMIAMGFAFGLGVIVRDWQRGTADVELRKRVEELEQELFVWRAASEVD